MSYAGDTAMLDPNADLDPNSVYTVTVDGTVKDEAGNALGANGQLELTDGRARLADTTVSDFGVGSRTPTPTSPRRTTARSP